MEMHQCPNVTGRSATSPPGLCSGTAFSLSLLQMLPVTHPVLVPASLLVLRAPGTAWGPGGHPSIRHTSWFDSLSGSRGCSQTEHKQDRGEDARPGPLRAGPSSSNGSCPLSSSVPSRVEGQRGAGVLGTEGKKGKWKRMTELWFFTLPAFTIPGEQKSEVLKWRFIQCFKSYVGKERFLRKDFSLQDLLTRNKVVA